MRFERVGDIAVCIIGALILGWWLLKTAFGRNALANSVPRRNNMPVFLPFGLLFISFGAVMIASTVARELTELEDWQDALVDNFVMSVVAIMTIVAIIFAARSTFASRLKGFGLNPRTIPRDFVSAVINLLGVWPLLLLVIMLTVSAGKLLWGQDFDVHPHPELELLTAHPQLWLRIFIVVLAVVIAPVFEEMLFRGMFQTMIRTFYPSPWFSIVAGSAVFTMVHANLEHWPALLLLGGCMGYSYEKSGSLFRPIFIHSLFNATVIIAVLCSA